MLISIIFRKTNNEWILIFIKTFRQDLQDYFFISGFLMKPEIPNPLRGNNFRKTFCFMMGEIISTFWKLIKLWHIRRQADEVFAVSSGNRERINLYPVNPV